MNAFVEPQYTVWNDGRVRSAGKSSLAPTFSFRFGSPPNSDGDFKED